MVLPTSLVCPQEALGGVCPTLSRVDISCRLNLAGQPSREDSRHQSTPGRRRLVCVQSTASKQPVDSSPTCKHTQCARLDLCMPTLHGGHANIICVVPTLSDDLRRVSSIVRRHVVVISPLKKCLYRFDPPAGVSIPTLRDFAHGSFRKAP